MTGDRLLSRFFAVTRGQLPKVTKTFEIIILYHYSLLAFIKRSFFGRFFSAEFSNIFLEGIICRELHGKKAEQVFTIL